MYVLISDKAKTGYKGIRVTDENVNSFPEKLHKIWLLKGIIKIKPTTKDKNSTNKEDKK